ncbi:hypothetical protein MO867_07330 [Microbulbifer sp. OS29]|uniref:DUF2232 domain-containing protein n=1 Tax=Microbulbifer okhotskensis TaxID=2926617 RepID=A0A9X2J5A1_9GAMM|nr:hypothetical protein [Microbulbifer okhotskensis]MCO1334154.1 hypothetical protein [Microbulbifer okhotskensis]
MRAVAEFIMRGRVRAVVLTMVGIPLISPAILALVSLRRGGSDGLMVLAWALLPIVVMGMSGHVSPLVTGISASHFAAVFCGAMALRSSHSWVVGLVTVTAASAVGILLTSLFGGGLLQGFLQAVENAAAQPAAVPMDELEQIFSGELQITGYLSLISAMSATLALVLGRYWQAVLYNPGGFRQEFQQLRLPLWLAAASMLLWVVSLVTPGYAFWGAVVAFPLVVAGIALIHWLVASRGWGVGPLVAMYLMLVIGGLPLAGFLCGLALVDSWIDIRGRSAK